MSLRSEGLLLLVIGLVPGLAAAYDWPCPQEVDPAGYLIEESSLRLERNRCGPIFVVDGKGIGCTGYAIELRGTGELRFEGEEGVPLQGAHSVDVGQAAFTALLKRFYENRFFSLRCNYHQGSHIRVLENGTVQTLRSSLSHGDVTILILQLGDYRKHMHISRFGAKNGVLSLLAQVDEALKTEVWLAGEVPDVAPVGLRPRYDPEAALTEAQRRHRAALWEAVDSYRVCREDSECAQVYAGLPFADRVPVHRNHRDAAEQVIRAYAERHGPFDGPDIPSFNTSGYWCVAQRCERLQTLVPNVESSAPD